MGKILDIALSMKSALRNIRAELTTKGALKLFEMKGPDVVEVFSQLRIVKGAGIQKRFKIQPGWSLDLTLDDPLTGKPCDLCGRAR